MTNLAKELRNITANSAAIRAQKLFEWVTECLRDVAESGSDRVEISLVYVDDEYSWVIQYGDDSYPHALSSDNLDDLKCMLDSEGLNCIVYPSYVSISWIR